MFENKRGQVTIFIIIAILVVAIGLIVYFFFPRAKTTISTQEDSPISYFQNCISDKIESTTETVSLQGGSFDVNFSNSYLYQGHYIKYLCYTKDNFKPCVNQEPFLEEHIESEILKEIQSEVEFCFNSLEKSYIDKDFQTSLDKGETKVDILPERVLINFNTTFTVTKEDSATYKNFNITINTNLYELLDITKNIVRWEMETGGSITESYMANNPYIKIEKKRRENDAKIYIIEDRKTGNKFQFAIRSFAYPPGVN